MESIRGSCFRARAFVRARPSAPAGPTKAFVVVFGRLLDKIDGRTPGRASSKLGLVQQRIRVPISCFHYKKRDFDGPFETRKRRAMDPDVLIRNEALVEKLREEDADEGGDIKETWRI